MGILYGLKIGYGMKIPCCCKHRKAGCVANKHIMTGPKGDS